MCRFWIAFRSQYSARFALPFKPKTKRLKSTLLDVSFYENWQEILLPASSLDLLSLWFKPPVPVRHSETDWQSVLRPGSPQQRHWEQHLLGVSLAQKRVCVNVDIFNSWKNLTSSSVKMHEIEKKKRSVPLDRSVNVGVSIENSFLRTWVLLNSEVWAVYGFTVQCGCVFNCNFEMKGYNVMTVCFMDPLSFSLLFRLSPQIVAELWKWRQTVSEAK